MSFANLWFVPSLWYHPDMDGTKLLLSRSARLLLIVSLCSVTLFAQHGGHGGASTGGGGGAPKEGGDPTAMADFARVLAVQASDDQKDQFQALAADTKTAHDGAIQLQQQAAAATPNAPEQATKLPALVDKAKAETRDFVKDFTKPQKNGLKPQLQKLSKADAELEHAVKALEAASGNRDQLASAADRLEKALAEFRSAQAALGDEMGIQPHP